MKLPFNTVMVPPRWSEPTQLKCYRVASSPPLRWACCIFRCSRYQGGNAHFGKCQCGAMRPMAKQTSTITCLASGGRPKSSGGSTKYPALTIIAVRANHGAPAIPSIDESSFAAQLRHQPVHTATPNTANARMPKSTASHIRECCSGTNIFELPSGGHETHQNNFFICASCLAIVERRKAAVVDTACAVVLSATPFPTSKFRLPLVFQVVTIPWRQRPFRPIPPRRDKSENLEGDRRHEY